jgi:hypothetical protein
MKNLLIIALLVSFISGSAFARAKQTPAKPFPLFTAQDCGDFLALTRRKPSHVTFEKCEFAPDRQGKPLVATYTVKGLHAAAVEAWLIKHANLVKLKRSCCQWDGPGGGFADKAGRQYDVYMVSEETTVDKRRNWREIAVFEITVKAFTEEP